MTRCWKPGQRPRPSGPFSARDVNLSDTLFALVEKIVSLRDLHRSIDEAIRDAYGWRTLDLQHDFHDLEFLPENDRVRYTVSTYARKEIPRLLLKLNHERHAEEVAAGLVDENGKRLKKKENLEGAPEASSREKTKTAADGDHGLF